MRAPAQPGTSPQSCSGGARPGRPSLAPVDVEALRRWWPR
jgi:hypothetical protein